MTLCYIQGVRQVRRVTLLLLSMFPFYIIVVLRLHWWCIQFLATYTLRVLCPNWNITSERVHRICMLCVILHIWICTHAIVLVLAIYSLAHQITPSMQQWNAGSDLACETMLVQHPGLSEHMVNLWWHSVYPVMEEINLWDIICAWCRLLDPGLLRLLCWGGWGNPYLV